MKTPAEMGAIARRNENTLAKLEAAQDSRSAPCSAWQCDLGGGEWDHDWEEHSDSSGECDGGPGDHWSWRECRVCGITEEEFKKQNV